MMLNNELEGMRKETVVVKFKILSCYLPEWTMENHEIYKNIRYRH